MRMSLLYMKGKVEPWAEEASSSYEKKISYFIKLQRVAVKSKSADRDNAEEKKNAEGEALLAKIKTTDTVVLFDEGGKAFKNSKEFSSGIVNLLEKSHGHIIFVIGGPYGFSEKIKNRAQCKWSLSGITMNHHIAQIVCLEQIYRAFTIWKGLPYHND